MIFIATTHTARSPSRSGIQSVTRGLVRGMVLHQDVRLVAWNKRRGYLHPLKPQWASHVFPSGGRENRFLPPELTAGPASWISWIRAWGLNHRMAVHLHPKIRHELTGSWLLLPELMDGEVTRNMTAYARRHGMKVAAIFHDAIPLTHPELTERTPEAHQDYVDALAETDLVIPTSNYSAETFRRFLKNGCRAEIRTIALPAEIDGLDRSTPLPASNGTVRILCVSTLEPRKNHRTLIEAFNIACSSHPETTMELHLVGDTYDNAPEITEFVIEAESLNPRITWHKRVLQEQLRALYRGCDFTVYPSFLEGFGMPVMESIWCGRPCLCSNTGVMAENAAGGGCLTTDVLDPQKLSGALLLLATKPELRERLACEIRKRPLKSWREYAGELLECLAGSQSAVA